MPRTGSPPVRRRGRQRVGSASALPGTAFHSQSI